MPPLDPRLGPDGHGPYRLLRAGREGLVRRFLEALPDPRAAQEERLDVILRGARGTAFGEEHGLDGVKSLEDWRAAVPVRTHAELLPWLDRVAAGEAGVLTRERVSMLLETSGTTGRPKHLPVTPTWARTCAEAQSLWVLAMVRDHEAVTRGHALTIVSPEVHARSPGGLPVGSNTGRMHAAQPWYVRARYPVPTRAFSYTPSELRLYTILRFALQGELSTITTANPSTVLLLARKLQEWREPLSRDLAAGTLRHGPAEALRRRERLRLAPRLRRRPVPTDWSPAALWPLALVNCWKGGPARYFVERLPEALGAAVPVREVGITASEGFFAVPLGDDWAGGVLWTIGHVMEFVGEDGQPRWAWELEEGEVVRLLISTEAGLYRYDLQDLLEVVGFAGRTPVLRFVGKAGRFLNSTGEKVAEGQVAEAVALAAARTGSAPAGFTARLRMGEVPHLELGAEGLSEREAEAFAGATDRALAGVNLEYDSKRSSGRMGPLRVVSLPSGTYAAFRARRVAAGAPEGQVKDPVVAVDEAEWARLLEAAQEAARTGPGGGGAP